MRELEIEAGLYLVFTRRKLEDAYKLMDFRGSEDFGRRCFCFESLEEAKNENGGSSLYLKIIFNIYGIYIPHCK